MLHLLYPYLLNIPSNIISFINLHIHFKPIIIIGVREFVLLVAKVYENKRVCSGKVFPSETSMSHSLGPVSKDCSNPCKQFSEVGIIIIISHRKKLSFFER